ncbi:hypothetical protein [Arthrobacter sp. SAFR-044]|uniref:hypothetical protein n=1 Tax=Arthrobacter sp. SAFR-044 TaxID=3387278 RepID=UPI003F7CA1E2
MAGTSNAMVPSAVVNVVHSAAPGAVLPGAVLPVAADGGRLGAPDGLGAVGGLVAVAGVLAAAEDDCGGGLPG